MHIALSRRRVARAASMRREVSHGRAAHGRAAHGRPLSPDPLHAHMHGFTGVSRLWAALWAALRASHRR